MSCTTPTGEPQDVDRELRARIDALPLPTAARSQLDELPVGVRVQLRSGRVELDDVAYWAALDDESRAREQQGIVRRSMQ
jgi:hypothetical protein